MAQKTSTISKPKQDEGEQTFRLLFTNHPIPMWIYDLKTLAFLDVNEAALEKYGYSHDEFIGMTIKDIRPPEEVERLVEDVKQKRPSLQHSGEWQHRLKNGQLIDVEITSHTLKFKQRQAVLVMAQDITERKQAENTLRDSQTQVTNIFNSAMDAIITVNEEQKIVIFNPSAEQMFGCPASEAIGQTLERFLPEYIRKEHNEHVRVFGQSNTTKRSMNTPALALTCLRADGQAFPSEVSISRLDVNGQKLYTAIVRDITERKRTEQALQTISKRFQVILSNLYGGILVVSDDGRVEFVNQAFCDLFDLNDLPEDLLGLLAPEIIQKIANVYADPSAALARVQEIVAGGQPINGEEIAITGERTYIRDFIPIVIDGEQYGRLWHHLDITEHKRVEKKLIASEVRYRRLFEAARDGILILDAETGMVTDVNPFLIEMMGFSQEAFLGKTLWELGFFKDIVANKANFLELQQKEFIQYEGLPLETADGRSIQVEFVSHVYVVDHHRVVQCNIRDITARKQAEDAQQQNELLFRTLFELSPDAVVILDPHDPNISSLIVDCNAAACQMNGYPRDEMIGQSIDIVNAEPFTQVGQIAYLKKLREAGNLKYEVLHRHKSGRVFPAEISTTIIKVGERELVIGIDRDITERKLAEAALRESQAHYRLLADHTQDTIWLMDMNLQTTYISPSVEKLRGFTLEEIQQLSLDQHLTPASLQLAMELFAQEMPRALADPTYSFAQTVELEFYRKDGSGFWSENMFSLIRDENGNPVSILGEGREITERKRAEEKIIASETRYRRLFEAARDGILILDADTGMVLDANPFLVEMLGFSLEQFRGKIIWELGFFKDIAASKANFLELQQKEYIRYEDLPLETADGRRFHVEFVSNVYQVNHQRVVQCNIRDITERKQAEETIRSLARFPSENPNPVLRIKRDGKLLYANETAYALLAEWDLQPDSPAPTILQIPISEVFKTQKTHTLELPCGDRVFSFSIAPASSDEYVNLYARDTTALFQAQDEIRQLNTELEQRVIVRTAQLEAANLELEAFSYSVSHDLRAPLRGIDGWSMALLEDYGSQLDEQAREYLARVRFETQRMGHLIDDLLQLSRLGRAEMRTERVNLSALAETVAARLQEGEPQRNVKFKIQKGLSAQGDAHLLEVVLTNLLDNAFKFTSKTPSAHIEFGQTEIEGQRAFLVRDNGAGFDMAFAKKLFGAFQRMHKVSDFPGTGVGLATVQRIIHRHGGRVWAESDVDQGATFFFTLEESI